MHKVLLADGLVRVARHGAEGGDLPGGHHGLLEAVALEQPVDAVVDVAGFADDNLLRGQYVVHTVALFQLIEHKRVDRRKVILVFGKLHAIFL